MPVTDLRIVQGRSGMSPLHVSVLPLEYKQSLDLFFLLPSLVGFLAFSPKDLPVRLES
jgi:hypothetical protein